MDNYSIHIQKEAQKELDDIFHYLAKDCMEPDIAVQVLQEIQETICSLSEMPLRFPIQHRSTIKGKDIRQVSVKNFIVFYKVYKKQKEVVILAVRHSSSIR